MHAQFEPGLPGTGPLPVHMHQGRPTPWSEGFVIRVIPDEGNEWIANVQGGYGYAKKIIPWPEAKLIFAIANGGVYLLFPEEPDHWRFLDASGIDGHISLRHELAMITTYNDVIAIRPDGAIAWRRSLAVDGVEIKQIDLDKIIGRACLDPPDYWIDFAIRIADGSDG